MKEKRNYLHLFSFLCSLLLAAGILFALQSTTAYADGSGTADDPFTDSVELDDLFDGAYIQTATIVQYTGPYPPASYWNYLHRLYYCNSQYFAERERSSSTSSVYVNDGDIVIGESYSDSDNDIWILDHFKLDGSNGDYYLYPVNPSYGTGAADNPYKTEVNLSNLQPGDIVANNIFIVSDNYDTVDVYLYDYIAHAELKINAIDQTQGIISTNYAPIWTVYSVDKNEGTVSLYCKTSGEGTAEKPYTSVVAPSQLQVGAYISNNVWINCPYSSLSYVYLNYCHDQQQAINHGYEHEERFKSGEKQTSAWGMNRNIQVNTWIIGAIDYNSDWYGPHFYLYPAFDIFAGHVSGSGTEADPYSGYIHVNDLQAGEYVKSGSQLFSDRHYTGVYECLTLEHADLLSEDYYYSCIPDRSDFQLKNIVSVYGQTTEVWKVVGKVVSTNNFNLYLYYPCDHRYESRYDHSCNACRFNAFDTEIRNVREASCTVDGYTGDVYCLHCNDVKTYGATIPATGNHTIENHICTRCGACANVNFLMSEDSTIPVPFCEGMEIPSAPAKANFTFHWKFDDTIYDTNDALYEALMALEPELGEVIDVELIYTQMETMYQINLYIDGKKSPSSREIQEGDSVSFMAPEVTGKNFVCWKDGAGNVLGYNHSFYLQVKYAMDLYAVYAVEEVAEPDAVISITAQNKISNGKNYVTYTATSNVRAGLTVIEVGVKYGTNENITSKLCMQKNSSAIVYNANLNLGTAEANKDRNVYGQAYVIYKDAEGVQHEVCTDIVSTTYNNLNDGARLLDSKTSN